MAALQMARSPQACRRAPGFGGTRLGGDDVPEVDENIAAQTLDPLMGDIDERNEAGSIRGNEFCFPYPVLSLGSERHACYANGTPQGMVA
uniref:hypothetical protein n=1 Tax=Neorhizobium sp. EC2-8 TaxID=3129230 RepID=UPI003101ACF5